MRNKYSEPLTKKVLSLIEELPYFEVSNLKMFENDQNYLKITLSRLARKGDIVRLKKGFYTARNFIERIKKENKFSAFLEFLAEKIYFPSYLSLDYVLYENSILTEIPQNFTLVTKNKTAIFSNQMGIFIYHTIKDKLFGGFETQKIGDFLVSKATKAKALFDFLYLRKNIILSKKIAEQLRLNLENFSKREKGELKGYIDLEGSEKMKRIYLALIK